MCVFAKKNMKNKKKHERSEVMICVTWLLMIFSITIELLVTKGCFDDQWIK